MAVCNKSRGQLCVRWEQLNNLFAVMRRELRRCNYVPSYFVPLDPLVCGVVRAREVAGTVFAILFLAM